MAANIPVDIIYLILLGLPVKSLLRFKCVCKAWQELIVSSSFIKSHLNHSTKTNSNVSLIFTHFSNYLHQVHDLHNFSLITKLTFPRTLDHKHVIGTCNGLICIRWLFGNLALCNPSTRIYQPVPGMEPVNGASEFVNDSELADIFNGSFGFGYDGKGDDYKIVKVLRKDSLVYSLRDNSWSRTKSHRPPESYFGIEFGKYSNNHLHWICLWRRQLHSFNLHDNTWGTVLALPDCMECNHHEWRLGVFDGGLCLSSYTHLFNEIGDFGVWMMKEYGEQKTWIKLFSLIGYGSIPVAYSGHQNDVLFSKVYKNGLFRYNSRQNTSEEVKIHAFPTSEGVSYAELISCMESLVPLRRNHIKLQGEEIKEVRIKSQIKIEGEIQKKRRS